MLYFVKSPWWLRKLIDGRVWNIDSSENILYLSFDDGPHPVITEQVLQLLENYNAKASFYCVGANVQKYSNTYAKILEQGHSVGNHTMNHFNASKVKDREYLQDVRAAKQYIDSKMFRPPYGKLSAFLQKQLEHPGINLNIVMWSILSGDFDPDITKEKCKDNVLLNAKAGDIVVFHDSEKAADKMFFALEATLKFFTEKGFKFHALNNALINEQLNK